MTPAEALMRCGVLLAEARGQRADIDHEVGWSDHQKRTRKEQLDRRLNELHLARTGAICAQNCEPRIAQWASWEADLLRVDAELQRRERELPAHPEELPGNEATRALRARDDLATARRIVQRGMGGQDGLMPSVLAEVMAALDVRPLANFVGADRWSRRPGLLETRRRLAEEREAFARHMQQATRVEGVVEREPDAASRPASVA